MPTFLNKNLPKEFENIFDDKTYRKSQDYIKAKTKMGKFEETFFLIITIFFWFAGGFNSLDTVVRNWNLHIILTGLLYIGILALIRGILSLPFSIYSTFVIEEKYEFNKTTVKTFILDLIKTAVLGILIGGTLVGGILALFEYAGTSAWFFCWITVSFFTLFIQYIAPTWIMPLFNKFTPLENGELRKAIISYAHSQNFPLEGVYQMDGSKRSTKSNAFFTGFGKNKRIVLFDTLILKHSINELIAILAHEVGHYKKHHILKGTIISILHSGIMFYLLSIFITHKGLFDAFYMQNESIYTGILFFGLLFVPIEFLLSLIFNAISRRNEFNADKFAIETTKNNDDFINALKKLAKDNLVNLTPHPFYVKMHYSHPSVLERIETIKSSS